MLAADVDLQQREAHMQVHLEHFGACAVQFHVEHVSCWVPMCCVGLLKRTTLRVVDPPLRTSPQF